MAGSYLFDGRMVIVLPEMAGVTAHGLRLAIDERRRVGLGVPGGWHEALDAMRLCAERRPVLPSAEAMVVLGAEAGGESELGTRDAAARLGVTDSRVRQLIRAKQLPARQVGRQWLIGADDVELLRRERSA